MLDTALTRPTEARSFVSRRRVRLSDMDAAGRVRLDAVARFLQDAAIDDVEETGWGIPDHIWVIRKIRIDVVAPLLRDRAVEIATWCSGVAAIAAGRRWSVQGDAGGRLEIDSVWIHLGPDQRPARIGDFGPYSAAGRRSPGVDEARAPRSAGRRGPRAVGRCARPTSTRNGHVNNAVYWQAVEDWMRARGPRPHLTASGASSTTATRSTSTTTLELASFEAEGTPAVSPLSSPAGQGGRLGRASSSWRSPAASTGRRCCRSSAPR